MLLDYWHNSPDEKFDFNAGKEKLEVKSNGNFERVHMFSAEQLYPSEDSQILIASVFVRSSNIGINIQDLIESINAKVSNEPNLISKLLFIISQSLGYSIEQAIQVKFDHGIAKDSLQFYRQQDIHKIEKTNIPREVFEVRYKSDLSDIKPINLSELSQGGLLFKSI